MGIMRIKLPIWHSNVPLKGIKTSLISRLFHNNKTSEFLLSFRPWQRWNKMVGWKKSALMLGFCKWLISPTLIQQLQKNVNATVSKRYSLDTEPFTWRVLSLTGAVQRISLKSSRLRSEILAYLWRKYLCDDYRKTYLTSAGFKHSGMRLWHSGSP